MLFKYIAHLRSKLVTSIPGSKIVPSLMKHINISEWCNVSF